MDYTQSLLQLSACPVADQLDHCQIMDPTIRPIWEGAPRIAGPVYPVQCSPGDNLMLHAAIYEAPQGAIIVADSGGSDHSMAGGNVCAIAQENGIQGMIIDGRVRDVGEIRSRQFGVYARGVYPKPGVKKEVCPIPKTITCGGVKVRPGDYVIADEEGIVVIPAGNLQETIQNAIAREKKDTGVPLEEWREQHYQKVKSILESQEFLIRRH